MDVSVCEDLSLCWRQRLACVRFPSNPAHRVVDRGSGATIHRTAGRAGTDSTEAAVKVGRCIETEAVAADKASTEADKATVALVAAAGAAAGCADLVAGCADQVAAGMHLQSRQRSWLRTPISAARSLSRRTGN